MILSLNVCRLAVSDLEKLFDDVDLTGRANLIWENGEFIVSREYYGNKVNLYSMPGFHAEAYYSPDKQRIFRIEKVTNLNKFLPFIDLPPL
jgi:hypothetical protein